jgi:hypothetical protein
MQKVLIQVISYVKVDVSSVDDLLSTAEQQKLAKEMALDEVQMSSNNPNVQVVDDCIQMITPLDLSVAHAFVEFFNKK